MRDAETDRWQVWAREQDLDTKKWGPWTWFATFYRREDAREYAGDYFWCEWYRSRVRLQGTGAPPIRGKK